MTVTAILQAIAPVLVALIGIIPTVIANRKKTQESIKTLQDDMKAAQDENRKSIAAVQTSLNEHIREDEDAKMRTQRYRILRFNDEVCEGRKHSESHFEDILDDIDDYEKYCEAHPQFKNSRGQAAMKNIRDTYERLKRRGEFLKTE